MSDRELLEAAAKAAGVEGHFCAKKELDTERWGIVTFLGYGQAAFWNPLADDGDALRLAVKLELFDLDKLLVDLDVHDRAASHHLEPLAATRRAIVRAAASISSSGEREGEG